MAEILSNYNPGLHNADLNKTITRLDKDAAYKDLRTIIITPCFGSVPTRVALSWESLIGPPNQGPVKVTAIGMEVGEAYSKCIQNILSHPELKNWKYICFREHDNLLPADGLINLQKRMEENPKFDAISGLYFTKGYGGVAQIWGNPKETPLNFKPQKPDPNGGLVECNGIGMGFALFKLKMFKDKNLRKPWFKTVASLKEGTGTQDLYFWGDAKKNGYRCAVDCSIRVGHFDLEGKFGPPNTVW